MCRPAASLRRPPHRCRSRSAAAQLGLSLLLAARRDAHAARVDERWLLRGGARLARLAAAGRRGQPGANADHVRRCRRKAAAEWEVPWLPGYEGSKPVRIGNAAHDQLQLDVYRRGHGRAASGAPRRSVDDRARAWDVATCACWTISQRYGASRRGHLGGARTAPAFHLFQDDGLGRLRPSDQERRRLRTAGADRAIGANSRRYSRRGLRARASMRNAALRAGLWSEGAGREPAADSPRSASCRPRSARAGTVEAIERELMVDGFVLRYDTARSEDGLPPGEGAFLACSFWLADAYFLLGRRDDARSCSSALSALQRPWPARRGV